MTEYDNKVNTGTSFLHQYIYIYTCICGFINLLSEQNTGDCESRALSSSTLSAQ